VHRQIILKKPFLKRLYLDHYRCFIDQSKELDSLPGRLLELGSGGGFLKDVLPDVITSEVCAMPGIDCVIWADRLPFQDSELKGLFLLNVLHHIPKPASFFSEASRCLVRGGRIVLIEPYNSALGRLFYKRFHHEPFDETVTEWDLPKSGRMTASNQAMPWMIFCRDRIIFEKQFPELRIVSIQPHTPLAYVLSGGMSFRGLVPSFSYPLIRRGDQLLSKWPHLFPILFTIILEKS
jgi:SAM-dependent methyltransferase